MKPYNKYTEIAAAAAEKAGKLLMKGFRTNLKIERKGVVDLVTEMDLASEKLLKEELALLAPEVEFFGEEESQHSIDWKNANCWIVDPLDGTTNYANGLENFCVSVAYCEMGVSKSGSVYKPVSKELYTATLGEGSFRNGERLSVNTVEVLNDCLAVTGFPYNRRECMDLLLQRLKAMLMNVQGVRRFGSAALDLCKIAEGVFSIYWETNLKPWDVAAGRLIVTEAGGKISKINGDEMELDSEDLLASNMILHSKAIELLKI